MELSKKNNVWLELYRYFKSSEKTPQGICQLFWGGLIGFLQLIISLPVSLIPLGYVAFQKERLYSFNGGTIFLLNLALLVSTMVGSTIVLENPYIELGESSILFWILSVLLMPLTLAVGLAIMFGIHLLIQSIKKVFNKTIIENQNVTVVKEGVKSKFTNICPRITWKD